MLVKTAEMLPSDMANVAKNDATASSEAEKGVVVDNAPPSINDILPDLDLPGNNDPAASSGASFSSHPDRPIFHVMPRSSWINDPNGLCFHAGRFHAFYQHLEKEGSADWDWAMAWGHASSADLAFWRREPVALRPTTRTARERGAAAVAAGAGAGEAAAGREQEERAGVAAEREGEAEAKAEAEATAEAEAQTAAAALSAGDQEAQKAAAAAAAALLSSSEEAETAAAALPALVATAAASASASSSAEGSDAAGCWSGCLVAPSPRHAREGMRPTLLYTGVVLRKDHEEGKKKEEEEPKEKASTSSAHLHHHHPLRPHAPPPPLPLLADLGLEIIERQLVAVLRDERDERLATFEKTGVFISHGPFWSRSPPAALSNSSSPTSSSSSSSAPHYFRYDSGFRDPFVYQRHDASKGIPWRVLIGSGKRRVEKKKEKEEKRPEGGDNNAAAGETSGSDDDSDEQQTPSPAAGTLLAYSCSTPDLALGPWKFEGEVVRGDPGRCVEEREGLEEEDEEGERAPTLLKTKTGEGGKKRNVVEFDVGRMWECPFLIEVPVVVVDSDDDEDKLPRGRGGERGAGHAAAVAVADKTEPEPSSVHLLCVSPYPHGPAITATQPANPPLYWLGELDAKSGTFNCERALAGPRRLDLGDVLYAPTAAAARSHDDSGGSPSSSSFDADTAAAAAGLASSSSAAAAAAAAAAGSFPPPPSLPPVFVVDPPIMMAWAQELRQVSHHHRSGLGYSGALTLPRELSVVAERKKKEEKKSDGGGGGGEKVKKVEFEFRLRQRPPASVSKLRKEEADEPAAAASSSLTAVVGQPAVEIPGARGPFADLELELLRPPPLPPSSSSSPSSAADDAASSSSLPSAVVLLGPWPHAGMETGDLKPCAAAAVVADWATGELSVVWPRKVVSVAAAAAAAKGSEASFPLPSSLQIDWEAGISRRIGGPCAGLRRGGKNRSLVLRVVSLSLRFFPVRVAFSLPPRKQHHRPPPPPPQIKKNSLSFPTRFFRINRKKRH